MLTVLKTGQRKTRRRMVKMLSSFDISLSGRMACVVEEEAVAADDDAALDECAGAEASLLD